jgi:predicted GNAT family N-acyltransferase
MLVPGRDADAVRQRDALLAGYTQLRAFERSTLRLIEPLRALRYLHHAAWITRRWRDPSFQRAFPHYGAERYWKELLADVTDQLDRIAADSPLGMKSARVLAEAAPALQVREVAFDSDDFQRVLMVREEVFGEELGVATDELAGDDRRATHLLAVDRDGRAVGAATLGAVEVHAERRFQRVGGIAVLPRERKRGAGRALVERADVLGRERGAAGLVADARVEVVGFFGALGFVALTRPFTAGGMTLRTMVRE